MEIQTNETDKPAIKRALVIRGGGAKGAWAGGFLQNRIETQGYDWDMYFGTSTGSLLITLTSIQEMDRLKEAYTSVNNDSIFSVNPFTKSGSIHIANAIWRIIRGKASLGESGNLEKLIRKMFTFHDFTLAGWLGKKLYPCVTDYTHDRAEYCSNMSVDYDTYVKYTLASTSVPIAMNFIDINKCQYLDGGVVMHVPIQKAIDEGADEIDIIILRPELPDETPWVGKGLLDTVLKTLDVMSSQISKSNVITGQLMAQDKNVKLRFRYVPFKLTDNSLMFDKTQMIKWWNDGYEYANIDDTSKKILLLANAPEQFKKLN